MVTILLQYQENPINLAVLLSQLQPQLHPDDDIYLIDNSKHKNGLKLATAYGTTRCYIFVETSPQVNRLKAGIQSMVDNNQHALIYLSENAYISSTFVSNMKRAIDSQYEIISPVVFNNGLHKMDPNFKFFNSSELLLESMDNFNPDCFMITRQSRKSYGLLRNEYVTILQSPDFLRATTEAQI